MKIDLIREEQKDIDTNQIYDRPPWFRITIDGEYVFGTWTEETANIMFERLLEDPFLLKKKEIVLESREIVVPLSEEITTKKEGENGKETS